MFKKLLAVLVGILLLGSVTMTFADEIKSESLLTPKFAGLNLQADFLYSLRDSIFMSGFGIDLATIVKESIKLRAEYATDFKPANDVPDKAGGGIGVDIPKLVELAGGKWLVPEFLPSAGVLVMADIAIKPKFDALAYVTAIKLTW